MENPSHPSPSPSTPPLFALCALPLASSSHDSSLAGYKNWQPEEERAHGFIQSQSLRLPARARNAGTSIANMTGVALKSYAVIGGTGAPLVIAKLREATDKATIS